MTKIDELLSTISKPRIILHDEPVSQKDWSDVVTSIAKLIEIARQQKEWDCPSVGGKYTRYPRTTIVQDGVEKTLEADPEPAKRWPGTVWQEITHYYAGCFFRAEGGEAKAFNSGRQEDEVRAHAHSLIIKNRYNHSAGGGHGTELSQWNQLPSHTGSYGGAETRPVNYSVKIYQRLA